IAKYSFSWGGGDKLIANKNHFVVIRESAVNETVMLVDWRTDAHHSIIMPPYLYESGFMWSRRYDNPLTLVDSGRVLAKDIYKNGYHWFLFDPFTQQKHLFDPSTDQKGKLERDAIISPSERYVVDLGESRCKLRKFPAHETVHLKDQEIIGFCSDKFSKIGRWENLIAFFSPDEKFFVIAFRRNIRVYRTEPFQLEFEGNAPGKIWEAKLSENGLLATSNGKGFVRVWDIRTKQAVGQHRFFDPGNEEREFSSSLIFHPDGNRLFVVAGGNNLYAFQLPKRGTE
ncbi:MAG: WD40 repeat domain-containing protein, partial [Betaproteobacteria bacterium]|nr:WD40 repeat domain-containing protein [Betaproteobacteria bacterium]